MLNSLFTEKEIIHGLSKLKSNKATGIDGLPAECLKSASTILTYPLTLLFNYILEKQIYPDNWAVGIVSPLHKAGEKTNPDNYRRITVQPAISKLYELVILNRLDFISNILQDQDRYNGGFKKGSQTSDNISILQSCIIRQTVFKKPLYVAFMDFKKAFDMVDRDLLFQKLSAQGKRGRLINIIKNMYSKTKSHIKINGKITQAYEELMGVSQGGVLSPYLFVQFLSDLRKYLDKTCGIQLTDSEILLHLLWADDLVLMFTQFINIANLWSKFLQFWLVLYLTL